MTNYQSWGGYPKIAPHRVQPIYWQHDQIGFDSWSQSVLPYGYGRSYGDSCLNKDGILLTTSSLNRLLSFNSGTGILRCESGISLHDLLQVMVPKGWFVPVTPGTQYVSIGGAIANDVHGKNHHKSGTFGCHVQKFEILRSNGQRYICSPKENTDLFHATIGGLGLTGVILWAEVQLKPIFGPRILTQRIRYQNLDEFFSLSQESEKDFEYTVAWIDCFANQKNLGRGIFIRGNHQEKPDAPETPLSPLKPISIPCRLPSSFLNPRLLRLVNAMYYYSSPKCSAVKSERYETFFYPLDRILNWNQMYGSRGLLQYQCLIPTKNQEEGIRAILSQIQQSGQGSFLGVLKQFGSIPSPGLLSFPRQGTTLALDFQNKGDATFQLLQSLDEIVQRFKGSVYPAKDARMNPESFQAFFPNWKTYSQYIDPKFSSSFWRRVTKCPSGDQKFPSINPMPTKLQSVKKEIQATHV